jgi:hypothetical protein
LLNPVGITTLSVPITGTALVDQFAAVCQSLLSDPSHMFVVPAARTSFPKAMANTVKTIKRKYLRGPFIKYTASAKKNV